MDVYVARQPILNINKETVAYELLFRDGFKNAMSDKIDGYDATQSILYNSMVTIGLEKIANRKKVFVNFTGKNIKNGDVLLLPPGMVYIEILENTEPTKSLIDICKHLREKGYKFALDDFVFDPKYQPFIDLADIIKIDFIITNTEAERQKMREIIPAHVKLLAEKVETEEEYKQALSLGYEYFQGYFFCRPVIISQKAFRVNLASQFLLLREVNRVNINIQSVEEIVKQDVSLVHKLLKYINSPYLGIRNKVHNIRQAIALLGLNGTRNWVNLICLRDLSAEKPNELFIMLLVRAKLCEIVAAALKNPVLNSETAFLVGMLSLSDVILDQPMEHVVNELGLADEIKEALLYKKNPIGELLRMVIHYERGEWNGVRDWCVLNHFSERKLVDFYNEAVHCATEMTENMYQ
ncbi:EAL and HDOD domain-containing protein [Pectinatus frisingensis]|uniref:EAL and HDOD domain-containing protein n=1 Tax=Pectinatus frisingensis TaxID=865 RepID=UPI0018C75F3C|nr:HDOD domain-containing protein [Pectinatus frisingensis]